MPEELDDPDNYFSAEQLAKRLTISVDTLNRLIKSGEFPGPYEISPGTKGFTREHLTYCRLRIKLRPYFAGGKGETDA